jgi:hypothetical protein
MSSEILIFTKSLTVGTPSPKVTKNPSQSSEVSPRIDKDPMHRGNNVAELLRASRRE